MSAGGGLKYKNTKDAVVLEETEFFGKKFLISENGKKPEWKLGAETKKIGNYICYKATLVKEVNEFSFASFGRRGRGNNNPDNKEKEKLTPKTKIPCKQANSKSNRHLQKTLKLFLHSSFMKLAIMF